MNHELRQGFRLLLRHPGFSLTAIVTLALGVGANAAVFAVAWHLLLKPLPWPGADRIVQVWNTFKKTGAINVLAPANYLDIERDARSFEAVAAYNFFPYTLNLTGGGEPIELRIRAVTAGYFRVFGGQPRLGRTIRAEDIGEGPPVLVISEGLWIRRFGSDPRIAGKFVTLDGQSYEIVGVMPASFDVGNRPLDGWIPYAFSEQTRQTRLGYYLAAVGRLRPDVTIDQARSELDAIAARAAETYPSSNAQIGLTARPIRDELVGSTRNGIRMLTGAAALVLLIACANLISLQIARGSGRERELAVRAALGATRPRLIGLLLTESIVLSIVAAYVGLIAVLWVVRIIVASAPPSVGVGAVLSFEPVVLGYTLLIAIAAGAASAIVPAWRATRPARAEALRGRSSSERAGARIRATLVTAEIALATVLLVSATVLVASMIRVLRVDPGFESSGVIAGNLRLPPARYTDIDARTLFFNQVFERLNGVPGIEASCVTNSIPFETAATMTFVPEGTETMIGALPVTVSEGCFSALRIQLLRGRLFDANESTPVAVVSEGFARKAFQDIDPLGRTIRIGLPTGDPLTIVGVVEDTRRVSLEAAPWAQVYQLAAQSTSFWPDRLLIRTSGPPERFVSAMQGAIRDIDPAIPLANIRTLDQVASRSLAPRRFTLQLLGGFAVIALVLAAIGIYGLLSELVAQRRSEIGVRLALGAEPRAIVGLVTAGALRAVAIGIVLGLAGAWAASQLIRQFTFQVSPSSPWVFAGTAVLLTVVACVAAYVPARRATRIDPIVALRAE
jgi:putative ABC transport system permease protein